MLGISNSSEGREKRVQQVLLTGQESEDVSEERIQRRAAGKFLSNGQGGNALGTPAHSSVLDLEHGWKTIIPVRVRVNGA